MPNLGFPEIMIILVVALLVFGPKKLPELGKSLGNGIREFCGCREAVGRDVEAVTLRLRILLGDLSEPDTRATADVRYPQILRRVETGL